MSTRYDALPLPHHTFLSISFRRNAVSVPCLSHHFDAVPLLFNAFRSDSTLCLCFSSQTSRFDAFASRYNCHSISASPLRIVEIRFVSLPLPRFSALSAQVVAMPPPCDSSRRSSPPFHRIAFLRNAVISLPPHLTSYLLYALPLLCVPIRVFSVPFLCDDEPVSSALCLCTTNPV